jgi:hypothetical protein
MKQWSQILLLSAMLTGSVMLLGACIGEHVNVSSDDYYDPYYGGMVGYGHPYYGTDRFWGGPGGPLWH